MDLYLNIYIYIYIYLILLRTNALSLVLIFIRTNKIRNIKEVTISFYTCVMSSVKNIRSRPFIYLCNAIDKRIIRQYQKYEILRKHIWRLLKHKRNESYIIQNQEKKYAYTRKNNNKLMDINTVAVNKNKGERRKEKEKRRKKKRKLGKFRWKRNDTFVAYLFSTLFHSTLLISNSGDIISNT